MRASTTVRTRFVVAAVTLAFLTTACGTDAEQDDVAAPDATAQTPLTETDLGTDATAGNETEAGEGSEEAPDEVLDVLDDALAGPDADGDDGRVFGASDDIVIQAVESTFSSDNAKAEWSGSTLRVTMDGSADDLTAHIPCTALEALLADGEDAVIVYDDGELVCADRP